MTVTITSGSASIYAGAPDATSHRVVASRSAGQSFIIAGVTAGEYVSVQSASSFSYQLSGTAATTTTTTTTTMAYNHVVDDHDDRADDHDDRADDHDDRADDHDDRADDHDDRADDHDDRADDHDDRADDHDDRADDHDDRADDHDDRADDHDDRADDHDDRADDHDVAHWDGVADGHVELHGKPVPLGIAHGQPGHGVAEFGLTDRGTTGYTADPPLCTPLLRSCSA